MSDYWQAILAALQMAGAKKQENEAKMADMQKNNPLASQKTFGAPSASKGGWQSALSGISKAKDIYDTTQTSEKPAAEPTTAAPPSYQVKGADSFGDASSPFERFGYRLKRTF